MSNKEIKTYELGNIEEAEIIAINDVHIGSAEFAENQFRRFIEHIQKRDNRFVLLLGDLMDMALINSVSDSYKAKLDPEEQLETVINMLEPIKHRIVGMVGGNHEARVSKLAGISVNKIAAKMLDVKNVDDNELIIKLTIGRGANGRPIAYTVVCHHGSGGGSKPGAGLNKQLEYSMTFDGGDIFVSGHTHKLTSHRYQSRVIDVYNNQVRMVDKLVVVSGSWLDYCGYPVRMQLQPGARKAGRFIINGNYKMVESVV